MSYCAMKTRALWPFVQPHCRKATGGLAVVVTRGVGWGGVGGGGREIRRQRRADGSHYTGRGGSAADRRGVATLLGRAGVQ
jgi:hypothetical protein